MFKELLHIVKIFTPPSLLVDAELNVVFSNAGAEKILKSTHLAGRSLSDIIGETGVKTIEPDLNALLDRGSPFTRNISVGGTPVKFIMTPLMNSAKEPFAVLARVSAESSDETGPGAAFFIEDLASASDKLSGLIRHVEAARKRYLEKLRKQQEDENAMLPSEHPTARPAPREYQKGTTAPAPRNPEDINIGQLMLFMIKSIEPKLRNGGLIFKHLIPNSPMNVRGIKDDLAIIFAEILNLLIVAGNEGDLLFISMRGPRNGPGGTVSISISLAGSAAEEISPQVFMGEPGDPGKTHVLKRVHELVEQNGGSLSAFAVKDRGVTVSIYFQTVEG